MGADPQDYDTSHGVVALGGELDVEDLSSAAAAAVTVDDAAFDTLAGDDAQAVLADADAKATDYESRIADLESAPAGGASEGAIACATADYTLTADNAVHAILWDDEYIDDSAYHSPTVNPSRITIPAGKGGAGTRFRIFAAVNIAGIYAVYLRDKDGNRLTWNTTAANVTVNPSFIVEAPADGDWFDVGALKASAGADLNTALDLVGGKRLLSHFGIEKLK